MLKVSKSSVRNRVRDGFERGSEGARQEFEKQVEAAREEVGKQADEARMEMGEQVLDLTDEYFPEAARQRRRRHLAAGAAIGVGAGFLARHLLDR